MGRSSSEAETSSEKRMRIILPYEHFNAELGGELPDGSLHYSFSHSFRKNNHKQSSRQLKKMKQLWIYTALKPR
jgi:hypothetical protein